MVVTTLLHFLAEVLNAKDVLIWTDVAGIYTTDPRVVPNAQRIDTMSFAEAAEMATFGAKVLHPATLLPAVRSNIPVYVGSSKAPEAGGTWVTRDPQPRPTFRCNCITSRSNPINAFKSQYVTCTRLPSECIHYLSEI